MVYKKQRNLCDTLRRNYATNKISLKILTPEKLPIRKRFGRSRNHLLQIDINLLKI